MLDDTRTQDVQPCVWRVYMLTVRVGSQLQTTICSTSVKGVLMI